jgi:hypothetical protein
VTGPYDKRRTGPLHTLDKAKADIASQAFVFASGVIRKLRSGVGDWTEKECRVRIRQLVSELDATDFAWVETFQQGAARRTVNCDVYGKKDDLGVWYIKFAIVNTTLLFSCHLAENDMELKNGKILRVR